MRWKLTYMIILYYGMSLCQIWYMYYLGEYINLNLIISAAVTKLSALNKFQENGFSYRDARITNKGMLFLTFMTEKPLIPQVK